jgi:hypothetical protein
MTPTSADLSLPAALRACARGLYPLEAGVGLLISHACWLHRQDFQDEFIHAGISIADGVTAMAEIDWAAAITALDVRHLPCSDLLTELPDVAAAQEATRPCGRSSRCPKHPDCQAVAAISPA